MRRAVLDASVIVSSLRSSKGASFAVMQLVRSGILRPLLTTALFLEYEDVLSRLDQRNAHGLTPAEINLFLASLSGLAEPVDVHYSWRPQLRDPNDEMVLEAAINGKAHCIVTHTVRDFHEVTERFRIPVLTPAAVVKGIRQ